jgi:Up-regulated During Septation
MQSLVGVAITNNRK